MSVVAAYTPTRLGRAVLVAATEESRRRETRLVVLNAVPGTAVADPSAALPEDLESLESWLTRTGAQFEISQSALGVTAVDAILCAAAAADVDVVVIGVRGRTPVGKLLLGSTAQQVILRSPVPVLAIREPAEHA